MRRAPNGDVEGSPRRAWLTFDHSVPRPIRGRSYVTLNVERDPKVLAVRYGCGVTGLDAEDCIKRVREALFPDETMPPIKDVVLDIDVGSLDTSLLSQLGNPAALGIWFPALNM